MASGWTSGWGNPYEDTVLGGASLAKTKSVYQTYDVLAHCQQNFFDVVVTAEPFVGDDERRRLTDLVVAERQIDVFHVSHPKNVVFTAFGLAYQSRAMALCCGTKDVHSNLDGIVHSLLAKVPIIIVIIIPSKLCADETNQNWIEKPDKKEAEHANNIASTVCKSTFQVTSPEDMLQVMLAAIVVSRSKGAAGKESGPGPVAVIIDETSMKANAPILPALLDPIFNDDLDLVNSPADIRLPGRQRLSYMQKRSLVDLPDWVYGISQVHTFVADSCCFDEGFQEQTILQIAKLFNVPLFSPMIKTESAGAIPTALGRSKSFVNDSVATKKVCCVFASLESLMENGTELRTAVENTLPMVVLVFRRSSCPETNVGVAGALIELSKAVGAQHAFLYHHSKAVDAASICQEALRSSSVVVVDCATALPSPKMAALGTHEMGTLWSGETHVESKVGYKILVDEMIKQCRMCSACFCNFGRENDVLQRLGEEMKHYLCVQDIPYMDIDDSSEASSVACGAAQSSPRHIVALFVPGGKTDSVAMYARLFPDLEVPVVMIGVVYDEAEEVFPMSSPKGGIFDLKQSFNNDSLASYLCKETIECNEGAVLVTSICEATAIAKSVPCGPVLVKVHLKTLVGRHDRVNSSPPPEKMCEGNDIFQSHRGVQKHVPLHVDPDVSEENTMRLTALIEGSLKGSVGNVTNTTQIPGQAIANAVGQTLSGDRDDIFSHSMYAFVLMHSFYFLRTGGILFSACKSKSPIIVLVLHVGTTDDCDSFHTSQEHGVRDLCYFYGAEHIIVNSPTQLQTTIKSRACGSKRSLLGPIVVEIIDGYEGGYDFVAQTVRYKRNEELLIEKFNTTKEPIAARRTVFPTLPFKFQLPLKVLVKKLESENKLHKQASDLKDEVAALKLQLKKTQDQLDKRVDEAGRRDKAFRTAITAMAEDHGREVKQLKGVIRRLVGQQREIASLESKQKAYLRKKLGASPPKRFLDAPIFLSPVRR
jgi:hypothetical protein